MLTFHPVNSEACYDFIMKLGVCLEMEAAAVCCDTATRIACVRELNWV